MFIELPIYYLATGYAEELSFNGQLYVQCPHCSFEERASPIHLAMVTPERLQQSECPNCGQAGRVIVRHREHVTLSCQDCAQTSRVEVAPWVQVRCPNCQSTRYEESGSEVEPALPPVFGELGERLTLFLGPHENKQHPWGIDGNEDAGRIFAELASINDEPDFHRHVLMGAMFARSLITGGSYPTEVDYYMMLNILGNLERQYFNSTGEFAVGFDAVGVFEDSVRVAPAGADRASAEHNVAMAINSLLIKYPEDTLAQATDRPHLRQDGIDAATRALATYDALAREPVQVEFRTSGPSVTAAQQAGRTHHIIGDLLAHGPFDDARLRSAIAHYEAALRSGLPDVMLPALRQSLAVALSNLNSPTPAELQRAAVELQAQTT